MNGRSRNEHSLAPEDGVPTVRRPTVRPLADISGLPTLPVPAVPSRSSSAPQLSPNPLSRFNIWLLSHFVTNPSSGWSLGYVDGLRALAALSVVVLHSSLEAPGSTFFLRIPFTGTAINFSAVIASGGVGVYLFFILSGFLLAQPWIEANYKGEAAPALKRYVVLRVTRIVPPFYLALLIMIIFFTPSLIPASLVYSGLGVFNIVAHLLFLQFLFPVSSASFRIALPFWSLTIEALFYLMLPVVVRAFYGRRWMIGLPVGVLISMSYHSLFTPLLLRLLGPKIMHLAATMGAPWYTTIYASFYIENQFPAHALEFALGITLANLYIQKRLGRASSNRMFSLMTSRTAGNAMFIAGCLITISAMYLEYPSMPLINAGGVAVTPVSFFGVKIIAIIQQYFEMVESVGFALILAGATYGHQMIRAALSFTPLRIIGIVSYTIYLLHLPMLHNVLKIYPVGHNSPNALFLKSLVTLLAQLLPISIFLYLTVERPIMRWARTHRAVPAPAPTPEPLPALAIPLATVRAQTR